MARRRPFYVPTGDGGGGGGGGDCGTVEWQPPFTPERLRSPSLVNLDLSSTIGPRERGVVLDSLDLVATVNRDRGAPALTDLQVAAGIDRNRGLSLLSIQTPQLLADKDVYVVQAGIDNSNHDGEDLVLDGLLASERHLYIAWDLSWFDLGSGDVRCEEALFTLHWQSAQLLADPVDIRYIAQGDEGWDEAALTQSNHPAPTGTIQNETWALSTGDDTYTLNAPFLAQIESRLGSTDFTIVYEPDGLNLLSRTAEAKDEGTSDADGPRLQLRVEKVL